MLHFVCTEAYESSWYTFDLLMPEFCSVTNLRSDSAKSRDITYDLLSIVAIFRVEMQGKTLLQQ